MLPPPTTHQKNPHNPESYCPHHPPPPSLLVIKRFASYVDLFLTQTS